MRRRLGLPAWLILAALASTGCGNGGPDRLTVAPGTVDFGTVLYGENAVRELVLKNHRAEDVIVTRSPANCRCVRVRGFEQVIRPGDERRIEVILETRFTKPGRLRGKKIDILSNDPLYPKIEVPTEADILQPFTVVPAQIDFGPRSPESAFDPRSVAVRPGPGLRMEVLGWRAVPPDTLRVEMRDAAGGVDFEIRPSDGAGKRGPFRAEVTFRVRVSGEGFPPRELPPYSIPVVGG